MLEAHGASRILASFHDIVPNWVFTGLYFPDEYLETQGDIVRKILIGMVRSFEFIKDHETEARKHLPKYTKIEEGVCMICALREYAPQEPIQHLNEQRDIMVQYGYLENAVDIEPMIDYSFLPEEYQ